MVITNEVSLPEISTLEVEEINLSMSTLLAAAPYIGKSCESINNEFVLCRQETNDPRACVSTGKQVTACAMNLLRQVKVCCLKEFNQYANCIDKSSGDYNYSYCRKTQAIFDDCMKSKAKIDRPDFGYFCRGRIHTSSRPGPPTEPCPCETKFPDKADSLPDSYPRKPARFSSRLYWMTE